MIINITEIFRSRYRKNQSAVRSELAFSILGTAVMIMLVNQARLEHFPALGALLSVVVIFWSWKEGVIGGLTSAALCDLYLAFGGGHREGNSLTLGELFLWAAYLPLAAFLVGTLSRRAARGRTAEGERLCLAASRKKA